MRAVVPEELLEERRRLGLDHRDELWDGVLHMVPPAGNPHQAVAADLFLVLGPLAKRLGLVPRFETGLFRTADDYRVPDQLFHRPDQASSRGAEGAELVVEILSPNDETLRKLPWYHARGVREVLVIDPRDRAVTLHRDGAPVEPARSDVLGVTFTTTTDGLHLAWDGGDATL